MQKVATRGTSAKQAKLAVCCLLAVVQDETHRHNIMTEMLKVGQLFLSFFADY